MISKNRLTRTLYTLICAASISACATSPYTNSDHGVLKDASGMTYYTFDKDATGSGASACYGPCAIKWPAVPSSASTGSGYDSVTRKDGSKQLTYQGNPLYYFAGDSKAGVRNGDGLGGVWHIVDSKAKNRTEKSAGYGPYSSEGGSY